MDEATRRLLDAHVQHQVARLTGDALVQSIERRVDAVFEWMGEVTLDEVATAARVLGVIDRFALELRVSGGITELAGEIARIVLRSRASEGVRVDEVLTPASFEQFADKILAFDRVRREIICTVVHSTALGDVVARVVAHALADPLIQRLTALQVGVIAGLSATLKARVVPELEKRVRELVARQLDQHQERLSDIATRQLIDVLDAATLRELADDVWAEISRVPLQKALSFLGEQDLEDLVVFVYEFWLRFRKTPYLRQLLSEAVDHFFAKYGEESLAMLVEDMGVTAEMVVYELKVFLVPLLDQMDRTGFLERQIRAELASFYESPAFASASTD